jgi:hypothetical protein
MVTKPGAGHCAGRNTAFLVLFKNREILLAGVPVERGLLAKTSFEASGCRDFERSSCQPSGSLKIWLDANICSSATLGFNRDGEKTHKFK